VESQNIDKKSLGGPISSQFMESFTTNSSFLDWVIKKVSAGILKSLGGPEKAQNGWSALFCYLIIF
jgi:hypothetical protein